MYSCEDDEEFLRHWDQLRGVTAAVFHRMSVPLNDEDAWQIARIALWYAITHHNPERGALTTYYYRVLMSHLSEYFASCHSGIQYPISLMKSSKSTREKRLRPVRCVSLDAPLDEDDPDETLLDSLACSTIDEVERRIALEQMVERFKPHLAPRQYQILAMMFGMFGHDPMDAADVARELGISRNTVNTTYSKALSTLRKLVKSNQRLGVELLAILG